MSGEILAKEGIDNTSTISDIVSSIWTDYNEIGTQIFNNEKLKYLIIQNEDHHIIATHLFSYIIAIKASNDANLGLIKNHLETIAKFLHEKLSSFENILNDRNEK